MKRSAKVGNKSQQFQSHGLQRVAKLGGPNVVRDWFELVNE
jgi:hypothetical protein